MRKEKLIGLLLIIAIASSLNGFASGLVPKQCTIENRQVCYPIKEVGFTFDGAIAIKEQSVATIYLDGQPLETGVLSCINNTGEKRTLGTAVITFEPPLVLPKGNTYRLVVPEGVIMQKDQPDISNEELSVEFSVPENLGLATPTIDEGSTIESTDRIGFNFIFETAPVENKKAMLLREGVLVREYDCDVSWDWNLGYAGIDFGERIHFENGVRYSIQLPEGSVSALYRSDIVNEKAEVSFIGGYTEPVTPIRYIWCSLYDQHPTDVLGEVKFFYDQPIALSADPIVQLYIENEDLMVKEVVPTLSEENGKWVLIADFENTPLVAGKGYSIIIPEGTLVTKDGDVIVNQRNVMSVENPNPSGIAKNENKESTISIDHGLITIKQAAKRSDIKLFSFEGKMINRTITSDENVSIPIPTSGFYLLSINGKTHKIVIK